MRRHSCVPVLGLCRQVERQLRTMGGDSMPKCCDCAAWRSACSTQWGLHNTHMQIGLAETTAILRISFQPTARPAKWRLLRSARRLGSPSKQASTDPMLARFGSRAKSKRFVIMSKKTLPLLICSGCIGCLSAIVAKICLRCHWRRLRSGFSDPQCTIICCRLPPARPPSVRVIWHPATG